MGRGRSCGAALWSGDAERAFAARTVDVIDPGALGGCVITGPPNPSSDVIEGVGPRADVDVVVVVAALVGLPDALDAQSVVAEGVQATPLSVGGRAAGRFGGRGQAGGHDAVADR